LKTYYNKKLESNLAQAIFFGCAAFTAFITLFFIGFIVYTALPVFESQGLNFLFGSTWDYSKGTYGMRIFLMGTLIMTVVTMILAVPVSIFTAIYIAEYSSRAVTSIMRPMIELLVGIPSVVYGIFGLFVLENIFQYHIDPFLDSTLGFIPIFQDLGVNGTGVLLASTVLAVMVLPTITTITEDSIRSVPYSYREASFAMGATHWQTIKKVVLPAASKGVLLGTVLGMMRAMGETMAIVMLLGNSNKVPGSLLDTGYAMTSKILNDIGYYVSQEEPRSALFGIAAVLFLLEIMFVGIARKIGGRV
jgi:phosphate transport system permease protein